MFKSIKATKRKEKPKNRNILFYGHSGEGKTHLSATAQQCDKTSSVLFINAEGGDETLDNVELGSQIDTVDIHEYKQFNDIYEFCQLHIGFRDKLLRGDKSAKNKLIDLECQLKGLDKKPSEPTIYKTVVMDSITEIEKLSIENIKGTSFTPSDRIDLAEIPDNLTLQNWGQNASSMRKLLRAFRDLEMWTIYNALEKSSKDDKTGEVSVLPSLSGKLANEICGFMDIVGRLYTTVKDEELVRVLMTQPRGKYRAKDRTSALGEFIVNPSIPKIVKMIYEKEKEGKKK